MASRERLSQEPLYQNGENDDAELMSKVDTIIRREEALKMYYPLRKFVYQTKVYIPGIGVT